MRRVYSAEDVRVIVDRAEVRSPATLRVERSVGALADEFRVSIPNRGGEHTALFRSTDGKRIDVELGGRVRFRGFCDEARFRALPEPSVELVGRDFSGLLIDEVVSDSLAQAISGGVASTAVTRIARAFGMTADADRTSRVLRSEGFAPGTSVWAVVSELAEREGFDAYVTPERVLCFKRRVLPSRPSRVVFVPAARGGVAVPEGAVAPTSLEVYTAKTLALGLKVRVTGYDAARSRSISYTAESKKRNRPNYRVVEIVDRGLSTKAAVVARAVAALEEISKGLVTGSYSCAVDGELEPGQAIDLRFGDAAYSALGGVYFVTKVVDELGGDGSFTTDVEFASRPLVDAHTEELERATATKAIPL
jgi:hypothetical protein